MSIEVVATWSLLVYGALLIIGGILGYVLPEKPSKISLVAGVATGGVAVAAFFAASSYLVPAFAAGMVVASLNEVVMAIRLSKTKKLMPAGMIVFLSGLVFLLLLLGILLREST